MLRCATIQEAFTRQPATPRPRSLGRAIRRPVAARHLRLANTRGTKMGAGASTTHTTRMDMTAAEAHALVDQVFTDDAVAEGLTGKQVLAKIAELQGHIENGHAPIQPLIDKSETEFAALNSVLESAGGRAANAPTKFCLGFISDQDENSRLDGDFEGEDVTFFESFFLTAELAFEAATGKYTFEVKTENEMISEEGDSKKRGAEYSILEFFNGKVVTACDRTGNLDFVEKDEDFFHIAPCMDAEGNRVKIPMGDGSKAKPFKCEWSCQIGECMYVGSTGKERTDDDGHVVHEGEMWVKKIDKDWKIEHVDWRREYNTLRSVTKSGQGHGYHVHEAGRWSEVHKRWFFFPRKLSREPYDEKADEQKCCNLFISADEEFNTTSVIAAPRLDFLRLRGCSDFLFIPGTMDTHLFVTRTEEVDDGGVKTFASVIDLAGNTLMEETVIKSERKFEGVAIIDGAYP